MCAQWPSRMQSTHPLLYVSRHELLVRHALLVSHLRPSCPLRTLARSSLLPRRLNEIHALCYRFHLSNDIRSPLFLSAFTRLTRAARLEGRMNTLDCGFALDNVFDIAPSPLPRRYSADLLAHHFGDLNTVLTLLAATACEDWHSGQMCAQQMCAQWLSRMQNTHPLLYVSRHELLVRHASLVSHLGVSSPLRTFARSCPLPRRLNEIHALCYRFHLSNDIRSLLFLSAIKRLTRVVRFEGRMSTPDCNVAFDIVSDIAPSPLPRKYMLCRQQVSFLDTVGRTSIGALRVCCLRHSDAAVIGHAPSRRLQPLSRPDPVLTAFLFGGIQATHHSVLYGSHSCTVLSSPIAPSRTMQQGTIKESALLFAQPPRSLSTHVSSYLSYTSTLISARSVAFSADTRVLSAKYLQFKGRRTTNISNPLIQRATLSRIHACTPARRTYAHTTGARACNYHSSGARQPARLTNTLNFGRLHATASYPRSLAGSSQAAHACTYFRMFQNSVRQHKHLASQQLRRVWGRARGRPVPCSNGHAAPHMLSCTLEFSHATDMTHCERGNTAIARKSNPVFLVLACLCSLLGEPQRCHSPAVTPASLELSVVCATAPPFGLGASRRKLHAFRLAAFAAPPLPLLRRHSSHAMNLPGRLPARAFNPAIMLAPFLSLTEEEIEGMFARILVGQQGTTPWSREYVLQWRQTMSFRSAVPPLAHTLEAAAAYAHVKYWLLSRVGIDYQRQINTHSQDFAVARDRDGWYPGTRIKDIDILASDCVDPDPGRNPPRPARLQSWSRKACNDTFYLGLCAMPPHVADPTHALHARVIKADRLAVGAIHAQLATLSRAMINTITWMVFPNAAVDMGMRVATWIILEAGTFASRPDEHVQTQCTRIIDALATGTKPALTSVAFHLITHCPLMGCEYGEEDWHHAGWCGHRIDGQHYEDLIKLYNHTPIGTNASRNRPVAFNPLGTVPSHAPVESPVHGTRFRLGIQLQLHAGRRVLPNGGAIFNRGLLPAPALIDARLLPSLPTFRQILGDEYQAGLYTPSDRQPLVLCPQRQAIHIPGFSHATKQNADRSDFVRREPSAYTRSIYPLLRPSHATKRLSAPRRPCLAFWQPVAANASSGLKSWHTSNKCTPDLFQSPCSDDGMTLPPGRPTSMACCVLHAKA